MFSNNTSTKYKSRSQFTAADQNYGLAEPLIDTMTKEDYDQKKLLFLQKINEADRTEIEIFTRDQSNNSLWFKERRLRITASNFGTICKMRPYTSCKKKIHSLLYAPNPQTKQLNYGNVMESKGRKKFEEIYNLNVQKCGLIIDSDIPYLAASPGNYLLNYRCIFFVVILISFFLIRWSSWRKCHNRN